MSEGYDNRNSGAIFSNDKPNSERSPTHTGQCEIVCPGCGESSEHWISAWVKEAKSNGRRFFSIAFTSKEEARNSGKRTSATPEPNNPDDFDDDIPF